MQSSQFAIGQLATPRPSIKLMNNGHRKISVKNMHSDRKGTINFNQSKTATNASGSVSIAAPFDYDGSTDIRTTMDHHMSRI